MTVMVVDDSSIIRRVLKNVINRYFENPTILEAEHGAIAMELLKSNDVNIMFLDWNMPVMDGEAVVNAIRSNSEWNNVRIIMATTEGGKDRVLKMVKKGVNGYLVKPFQEDKISKALDNVMARMR